MTQIETLKVFAVLKVAYPAFDARLSDEEYDAMIKLWAEMFQDDPYEIVGAAVKAFIASDIEGYPPSIGKIKAAVNKITQPEQMTEQEAVNLILNATRNSAYNASEEYKKLPQICQQLVGNPKQLREWSLMSTGEINTVVASNLQRSYKVLAKRERELQALPASVKQFMLGATSELLLK